MSATQNGLLRVAKRQHHRWFNGKRQIASTYTGYHENVKLFPVTR